MLERRTCEFCAPRRGRGAVLSRRAEGRSCCKALVKVECKEERSERVGVLKVCGDRELRPEGVESGSVWTELSVCVVLSELSEECTRGRAGGAHVAREARGGRTEGRRAKGKSRLLSYFFLFGFIVQMLVGRRLSG